MYMQMQNAEDTGAIASRFDGLKSNGNPFLMDIKYQFLHVFSSYLLYWH